MTLPKHIIHIAILAALPITLLNGAPSRAQDSAPTPLGQSGWTRPQSSSSQPSSSGGLGQSGWIQPAGSSTSTLGQSQWIKPGGKKIAMGQSNWVQPSQPMSQLMSQPLDYARQPMFHGAVDQNVYNQAQFMPAQMQPMAQMGNMMPGSNMNDIGYQVPMNPNMYAPTDNFGKAIGLASQLGIDMNQPCDDTTGGVVNNGGMTNCARSGMSMPYIPGTQMFNRTADRASRTANRALDRFLNRAINNMGR